jgi:hypothetical protein
MFLCWHLFGFPDDLFMSEELIYFTSLYICLLAAHASLLKQNVIIFPLPSYRHNFLEIWIFFLYFSDVKEDRERESENLWSAVSYVLLIEKFYFPHIYGSVCVCERERVYHAGFG